MIWSLIQRGAHGLKLSGSLLARSVDDESRVAGQRNAALSKSVDQKLRQFFRACDALGIDVVDTVCDRAQELERQLVKKGGKKP